MKTLYRVTVIFISIVLTSCATVSHSDKHPSTKPYHKHPSMIALDDQPDRPYKVIGKTSISRFNSAGFKRQQAVIHDHLRILAASLGGDAIIHLKHKPTTVSGTVITYLR